jgi:hypothetical protein
VLVRVTRALPVWSPAYGRVADEVAMRELWRPRRDELEAMFEAHIQGAGPFLPPADQRPSAPAANPP